MPLAHERYHDYDLTRFETSHAGFAPDPRGRRREREITLLPMRPDLQEQPVGIDSKVWNGVLRLVREQNFVLPDDDLTPPLAHELAKVLKAGLEELDRVRQAVETTLEICGRQRGLRVGWRYADG